MFLEEDRVLEEIIHDILEDEVEEQEEMHSIISSEDSARYVSHVHVQNSPHCLVIFHHSIYGQELALMKVEDEMDKFRSQSKKEKRKVYYLDSTSQLTNTRSKPKLSSIRIFKSDVRRKFAFMFANVMNSYDYALAYGFFRTFGEDNLMLRKKFYVSDGNGVMFHPIRRDGIRAVADYFHANNLIAPDAIFRCGKTQIKPSKNNGIEILAQVNISGTRLFNINSSDILQFIEEVYQNNQSPIDDVYRDPMFEDFWQHRVQRLDTPISFHINGLVTLEVNDRKQISRIKFRSFFSYGYAPSPF